MGGGLFALFGIVFIVVAIVQSVYNFRNATSENRFSSFDITDASEESDPLNERFGKSQYNQTQTGTYQSGDSAFCPYCGTAVEEDYEYCNKCGKKLP